MPHDVDLIILLAVGFGLALVFGYLAARLRLPPLIGYLVAGILISPNTPGVVGDLALANLHLGVMSKLEIVPLGHKGKVTLHETRELEYVVLGRLELAPVTREIDVAGTPSVGVGLVREL